MEDKALKHCDFPALPESYNVKVEFPTAPALGHTQAAAARDGFSPRTPRPFSALSAVKSF
jgi:hypothetical protein